VLPGKTVEGRDSRPSGPASIRPRDSGAGSTGPRRTWTDRTGDADAEERRVALPKMFLFVLIGWLAFIPLDLFAKLVIDGGMPMRWMLAWRAVGTVPPLIGWLLTRKKVPVTALSTVLEVSTFCGLAFCLAMRALAFGGLDSRLVQGISLLLMVQTLAVPSRWQRMALPVAITWSTYPLTMLVAAFFSPAIASQWHSTAVQGFAVDYGIVAGFAVGGVIGAHIIWSMRRQLYYARRLGRYRLKARIGHGGTSEVWLAWDDALRRDVALKILDRTASIDAIAITRFEREAMAASGLQSPHTIRVFDFGASDDGVWFMAMEHLEGMDLATLVDEMGPLPVARVVRFARQACAALSEAHDAGVVHRDVKPDNLFVCRMGDEADFLKVLDFGIAKIEGSEEASVTRAGWVHGTPSYMSPEACNGTRVDARSDIYSLGAVLYFLLTGVPPFQAATGAAVMLAHVSEEPEPPSTRGIRIPRDLERVVMKCLDKDPDARFQSARELDEALAACGDALATTGERVVAAGVAGMMRRSSRPLRAAIEMEGVEAEDLAPTRESMATPAPRVPPLSPGDLGRPGPGAPTSRRRGG
jgi:serine/threonine-protein kinase